MMFAVRGNFISYFSVRHVSLICQRVTIGANKILFSVHAKHFFPFSYSLYQCSVFWLTGSDLLGIITLSSVRRPRLQIMRAEFPENIVLDPG